jgi:hypothetical protein
VNSSVCEFYDSYGFQIGSYDPSPFTTKEINGFYAVFQGPEIINKISKKPCNLSITFEFDCDKNAIWLPNEDPTAAPVPMSYTGITADSCDVYKTKIHFFAFKLS